MQVNSDLGPYSLNNRADSLILQASWQFPVINWTISNKKITVKLDKQQANIIKYKDYI